MRNGNHAKHNSYWNKIEAWKDWQAAAETAISMGLEAEATELWPKSTDGWRTIDKKRKKLEEIIQAEASAGLA